MTYDLLSSEAHGSTELLLEANSCSVLVVLYLDPSSSCRLFSKYIYKVCAKLSAKSEEMAFRKASKQPLVRLCPETMPHCPV
jgi:hypothetical protein